MTFIPTQDYGCTDLTDQQLEKVKGGGHFWRYICLMLIVVISLAAELLRLRDSFSIAAGDGYYTVYGYEYYYA